MSSLIPKTGVLLLIAPPGAAHAAMVDYFSLLLSGHTAIPFGAAKHPADVLVLSHTLAENSFLNRNVPILGQPCGRVYSRQLQRPFNWRIPLKHVEPALSGVPKGRVAALVIDAGPVSASVDDAIAETAEVQLREMSNSADCVILIVAESRSRSKDPFERIPKALTGFRDAILVCSLRPKEFTAKAALSEFLLFRLAHRTPAAWTVRFSLAPCLDEERANLNWELPTFTDPREALRAAETEDLRGAQLLAAQFARAMITQHGPLSLDDLKTMGRPHIKPTTMRDALGTARDNGFLQVYLVGRRWLWGLPDSRSELSRCLMSGRVSGLFKPG